MKKVRAFAEHSRDSFEAALFQIAALGPLVSSERIIQPLTNTYAANTLNMLQWTLYGHAAINLCKSLFDRDERSGSLTMVLSMLEAPDLASALRAEQARPTRSAPSWTGNLIPPAEREAIEQERMERDRRDVEERFDREIPRLHKGFAELRDGELAQRILKARDKVLAHGELRFDGQEYVITRPEDFGLKWGDSAALVEAAKPLLEMTFSTVFAQGFSLDQSSEVFQRYSADFWRHLEVGLAVPREPFRSRGGGE